MVIEFLFREYISENLGVVCKPFAEISLINIDIQINLTVLIDSGADITLIPKITGDSLQLTTPTQDEIKYLGGIAGGVPVVYRTINLQIEGIKFPCRIAWAQIEDVPTVLGRIDVFDKFNIEFKQTEKKIIFTAI